MRASAATQGPQAGAEKPQPGCQPVLAVCREPLYRQKSPSREGAGSSGSYQVPEVRGSRGRRVHATNSTAGATLVRARQDVKRARQASAPALLPSIFPGPTASRVVSLQWVWMGREVREGTAALSAEDLSLGRREGVLFRSPGILGRGCWQGGCRRGCGILQEPEKSLHHPEVLWAFWATSPLWACQSWPGSTGGCEPRRMLHPFWLTVPFYFC